MLLGTGRQIKVFHPIASDYRYRETRPIPLSGGRFCITGSGRTIVAGADTRSDRNVILHEIPSRTGETVRSFGVGYLDSSLLVRHMMANRGPVACVDYQGTESVVHAFAPLSFLRLMSLVDGSVFWTAQLMDHRQLMMESDRTGFTQNALTDWDIVVSLLPYLGSHLLLQVQRFREMTPEEIRKGGRPESTFSTYLLDLPTGRGARVATGPSRIVGINESRYAVVSSDPYPQIEVRALEIGGIQH